MFFSLNHHSSYFSAPFFVFSFSVSLGSFLINIACPLSSEVSKKVICVHSLNKSLVLHAPWASVTHWWNMVIPFLLFSTLEWIESFLFGFRPLSKKTSYSDFRFLNFLTASGIIWIMLWFLFCRRNRTIILSANRTSFILFAVQLSSMSFNKQLDISLAALYAIIAAYETILLFFHKFKWSNDVRLWTAILL